MTRSPIRWSAALQILALAGGAAVLTMLVTPAQAATLFVVLGLWAASRTILQGDRGNGSTSSADAVRLLTLSAILENEPECVKTVLADGSLDEMNAAGLRLIEADSLEEVRGACVFDLLHPEHRQDFEAMHEAVMRGESRTLVFRIIGLKGTERWMETNAVPLRDDRGQVLSHLAITRDISESVSREKELNEANERFRIAVQGSSDGLWDYDPRSEEVWYSPRFLEMLGYREGEWSRSVTEWSSRLHEEDREATLTALESHLTERAPFDVEYRLVGKDGSFRWYRARGQALWNEAGEPTRMAGNLTDIQEHKTAQESLAQAVQLAELASTAKSEFLANMSHEIRTPMTAILGFTDLLTDSSIPEAERHDYVLTIKRNGEHLLTLLNDILDLSRIEAGRMDLEHVAFNPLQVIRDIEALLRQRAREKGLDFRIVLRTALPEQLSSDPLRLRQILLNLLGNALKFTEEGSVSLEASAQPTEGGMHLTFEVADTGIGIAPGKIEQIFETFSQEDNSMTRRFGGTGLGLHISRRLAKMLGGSLTATSVPGEGSRFRLELPCESVAGPASPTQSAPKVREAGATPLAQRTVLLAEDGKDNQRLIRKILEKAGATVEIADNGALAVHAVDDRPQPFDLILMDMQMPEMDGYEATRTLRDQNVDTPVIAITAHAMSGDRERCLDAGCSDFTTKPIDRRKLLEICAHWLERSSGAD